ncbi:MAG: hypothetical protein LBK41_02470 [Clostridiales bacterium]|nr:hypothetical protein [Clostridiales bacterium]
MGNKSKKAIGMAMAAVVSFVVFASTAMAASRNVSGYEKVRESLFKYYDLFSASPNFTARFGVSALVDGAEFVSTEFVSAQQDEWNRRQQTTITIDGQTSADLNSYNDGVSVYYDEESDTYSMHGSLNDKPVLDSAPASRSLSENERRLISAVFDMFAGDAKNYCAIDGDRVTLRLERAQIPDFFQALISVVSENVMKQIPADTLAEMAEAPGDSSSYLGESYLVGGTLLKVVGNASFNSVDASGVIDADGLLNDVTFTIGISGEDLNGAAHNITFNFAVSITDIGTTVAPPLDTTGKQVNDYTYSYTFPNATIPLPPAPASAEIELFGADDGYIYDYYDTYEEDPAVAE